MKPDRDASVRPMKTVYYPQDDVLETHLSDKPVARETSQDWGVHLSWAADGTLVEVVVLDAAANGLVPAHIVDDRTRLGDRTG